MMTPSQLAALTLSSITDTNLGALLSRIQEAMRYHTDFDEMVKVTQVDKKFTPRLYTSEEFCACLCVENLRTVQSYHCRSLLFATQKHTAECKSKGGQTEWVVDVYPKGKMNKVLA